MGLFGKKETQTGPAPLAEYKVTYKGGLAQLPKAKVGGIMLQIWPDRFDLQPTTGSKSFWQPLTIPYPAITDLQIVQRQVGGFESVLAAGSRNGTRDLQTDNNLHLHYTDATGTPTVLRLEMLTGVTVSNQAAKCTELDDLLRTSGIRQQFHSAPAPARGGSLTDELARLQDLAQQGVLSPQEFAAAKAQLLGL
jgi:hypothetical protein